MRMEQARIKEKLAESERNPASAVAALGKAVELAKSPSLLYKTASPEKKRELLKSLVSNLAAAGKKVELTLALPFRLIAEREKLTIGGPYRGTCRTWTQLMRKLLKTFEEQPIPAN